MNISRSNSLHLCRTLGNKYMYHKLCISYHRWNVCKYTVLLSHHYWFDIFLLMSTQLWIDRWKAISYTKWQLKLERWHFKLTKKFIPALKWSSRKKSAMGKSNILPWFSSHLMAKICFLSNFGDAHLVHVQEEKKVFSGILHAKKLHFGKNAHANKTSSIGSGILR